jgi:spore coat protein U-like protein
MRARSLTLAIVLVLGLTLAPTGHAASPVRGCQITATHIDFGGYDPLRQGAVIAVGYVSFRCSVPARNIRIQLSSGPSGNALARRLTRPGAPPVRYQLSLDAGQTQVWGDGFGGSTVYTLASAPANTEIRVPMYAAIIGQDPPTAGGYTDTVRARLTWN